jgi:uncharacterized membrane protein YsdA (DUF1294 family)
MLTREIDTRTYINTPIVLPFYLLTAERGLFFFFLEREKKDVTDGPHARQLQTKHSPLFLVQNSSSTKRTLPTTMSPRRPPQRHRPVTLATTAGVFSLVLPAMSFIRLYASTGALFPSTYTAVVSGVTFLFYGYDKMQARNLEWRVKESTLHMLGLIGGWPGALAGMHYFQHKTRKRAFLIPFWIIVAGWQLWWWAVWSGGVTIR